MQLYLPIAEISLSLPMLVALGLAVGVLSGLFGIGGGFVLTPMLIFIGITPAIAVGTGTALVTASSVSGALGHWQRRNVDLALGIVLVGGGLFGVLAGIRLQQALKAVGQLDLFTTLTYVVLLGIIGVLMLIESTRALRERWQASRSATAPSRRRGAHHSWIQGLPIKHRFRIAKLYMSVLPPLGLGFVVGWLTAIMGVGGGFLLVPAMIYMLRVPTRIAFGTSAFQIIFVTAFATLMQATQNHSVDALMSVPLILGGVAGAQIGVTLSQKLEVTWARWLLGVLVVGVAVRMAASLVLAPADLFQIDRR